MALNPNNFVPPASAESQEKAFSLTAKFAKIVAKATSVPLNHLWYKDTSFDLYRCYVCNQSVTNEVLESLSVDKTESIPSILNSLLGLCHPVITEEPQEWPTLFIGGSKDKVWVSTPAVDPPLTLWFTLPVKAVPYHPSLSLDSHFTPPPVEKYRRDYISVIEEVINADGSVEAVKTVYDVYTLEGWTGDLKPYLLLLQAG